VSFDIQDLVVMWERPADGPSGCRGIKPRLYILCGDAQMNDGNGKSMTTRASAGYKLDR
jgi:hypothetical protein